MAGHAVRGACGHHAFPGKRLMRSPVLHPVGLFADRGRGAPVLADGWVSFTGYQEISLAGGGEPSFGNLGAAEAERRFPERVAALTGARAPFAGVSLERPRIAAVVNVTPDSFSDGGQFSDPASAIDRVAELAEAGADIIDIGGESTRPGAAEISVGEELRRVIPVIEAAVGLGLPVSVDTRRAEVMREAIAAGVSVVNDVTALSGDAAALEAVASSSASVVLMHMQGTPATMQERPGYRLASAEIFGWLESRVEACIAAGIGRDRIAVDPGIGFGKTDAHNIEILERGALFHGLGCAVMIGVSRKSFIGRLARVAGPADRLAGTVMATAIALSRGVQLHRVHDAADIRQALAVWRAVTGECPGG